MEFFSGYLVVFLIVTLLVLAVMVVTVILGLYWVTRKAVAAGIRDARVDDARRQTTHLQ